MSRSRTNYPCRQYSAKAFALIAIFMLAWTTHAFAFQQLVVDKPKIDFGPVQTGSTFGPIVVQLVNVGSDPITLAGVGGGVSAPFSGTQGCEGATLAPGASCPLSFSFTPSAPGLFTATSSASYNGFPAIVELTGQGLSPQLVLRHPEIDFGQVLINTTSPTVTTPLVNMGTAPITLACAGGGLSLPFSVTQGCQGTTLAPGQSCPLNFSFSPTATGPASATSSFSCNGVAVTASIKGEGVTVVSEPALVIDLPAVNFGPVNVGQSSPTVTVQLRNQGNAPVTVSCAGGAAPAPFASSQGCQGVTLAPGQSCPRNFSFSPEAAGPANAVSASTCNGIPLLVSLAGTGVVPALVIETPAVDFGTVELGHVSPIISVKLVNRGPVPITIACSGGGVAAPFSSSQGCQGVTLAPGQSCPRNFAFSPTEVGTATGSSNSSCNGKPLLVQLTGLGYGTDAAATSTPAALNFATQIVGTISPNQSFKIINAGLNTLSVSGIELNGNHSDEFLLSGNCSPPLVLGALESCTGTIRFLPAASGPRTAQIDVTSSAEALTITLTGTGQSDQVFEDRFQVPVP